MSESNFFLHPPAQSTTRYVQWYEKLMSTPGIDYGCVLDKRIIPLHPGDLMAVVARPGHGKTSWMAYMAKRAAAKIVEANQSESKCVIFVSWEQPIEELEAFFQSGVSYSSTDLAWGRVPLDTVKEHSIKRINMPIWMIGYSIGDADKRKPPMTIEMVQNTIRDIRYEYGLEPTLLLLDYLQIIPTDKKMDRTEQVTEATIMTKHLAKEIGVPTIAGVQAARTADKHKHTPPNLDEAQHSSAIEQTADKQISLLRASKVFDPGEFMEVNNHMYQVNNGLLVIKLLKQRFDSGSGTWAVNFEPQTLTLRDYTIKEMA